MAIQKDALAALGAENKKEAKSKVTQRVSGSWKYMESRLYRKALYDFEEQQNYMGRRYLKLVSMGMGRASNEKYPLASSAHKTYTGMLLSMDLDKVEVDTYSPQLRDKYSQYIEPYRNFSRYFFSDADNAEAYANCVDEAVGTGTAFATVDREEFDSYIVTKATRNKSKKGMSYSVKRKKETFSKARLRYIPIFDVLMTKGGHKNSGERIFVTRDDFENAYPTSGAVREMVYKTGALNPKRYDNIKNINDMDYAIKKKTNKCCQEQLLGNDWSKFVKDIPDYDEFFSLKNQDLVEVIKVYQVHNGTLYDYVLANGILVSAEQSRLPFNYSPIQKLVYNQISGEDFGRSIYEEAKPYQVAVDTLYNTRLTATLISSAPMYSQEEDFRQKVNKNFQYRPFGIRGRSQGVETTERIDLVDYTALAGNLQAIQIVEGKFNSSLGLNPYVTGAQGGIERSAKGVDQRIKASLNKFVRFTGGINDWASKLVEMAALYHKVYGDDIITDMLEVETVEEEQEDGTNKSVKKEKNVVISTKDLVNGFKISFNAEDIAGDKDVDVRELIELLGATQNFDIDVETNEKILDNQYILNKAFSSMGFPSAVTSRKRRLEQTGEAIEHLRSKGELTAELKGEGGSEQGRPIDRVMLNIAFKDLDENEQKVIMQHLGLLGQEQQQQVAEQVAAGGGVSVTPGAEPTIAGEGDVEEDNSAAENLEGDTRDDLYS